MSLDLQQISPELKTLLLDLKNLSPMHRFAVVSRPREELKWKTVAAVYGIEKLEANGWMIPESELSGSGHREIGSSDDREKQNQKTAENAEGAEEAGRESTRMNANEDRSQEKTPQGAEEPEEEDPAALEARMEQEKAEGVKRAIELNAQVDKRYGAWGAELIPTDVQLSKLPNFNPDYVLADDGHVEHVITVQHALKKEILEKLGVPEEWRPDTQKIAWHKEQLRRLEKADHAPRCEHVYMDGTGCRAPKLKEGRLCYAHERMERVKPKKLRLLPPEDANAIVVNLIEIGRALVDDEISERKAGLLMYQQQLALIALKQVTFKTTNPALMIRELPSGKRFIHHGDTEARRKSGEKNQLTTKGTHSTPFGRSGQAAGREGKPNRPQMNADDRRLKSNGGLTTKATKGAKEGRGERQDGCADGAQPAQAGVPVPHNRKPTTPYFNPANAQQGLPGAPVVPHKSQESTPGMNGVSHLDSGLTGLNDGGERVAAKLPTGDVERDRRHRA